MLSFLYISLVSCGAALLVVGIMFSTFAAVAYNRAFFRMEYRLNDTAKALKLSDTELERLTDKLVRYFSGRDDSLQTYVTFSGDSEPEPFYSEDELSHMADVKVIFAAVNRMTVACIFIPAIILIAVLLLDKRKARHLELGSLIGSAFILLFFIALGLYVAVDFEGGFVVFHKIFFPQGNWSFSSDMIILLPETLFLHATIIILCGGIVPAVALLTFGAVKRKKQK